MHILKNGYLFALWLPDYGWKAIREINTRANFCFGFYLEVKPKHILVFSTLHLRQLYY